MEWRSRNGITWLEARLPGARAVFSTRHGGVSSAPFANLNLGSQTGDQLGSVVENRRRLAGALGFAPKQVLAGRQVHGNRLAVHRGPQDPSPFAEPGSPAPEVDGHVTDQPGLAALVFVADCLPLALVGPRGLAVLHCGWRGLAAGIVARGVEAVEATDAAIGPGIGPCCYEVGEDVLDVFSPLDGAAGGRSVDLAVAARCLLEESGVQRIEIANLCTSCDEARFFSHRRDAGRSGRQAGIAWLEDE